MAYTVPANFQTRLSDDEPTDLTASTTGAAGTSDELSRADHRHGLPASLIFTFVDNETPTGAISGTTGSDGNAAFTLAQTPSPAGSLILVLTGVIQLQGTDYTLAGNAITYVAPKIPITGNDWHRAWYRY